MNNRAKQLSYRILEKLSRFHLEIPSEMRGVAQDGILGVYLNSEPYFNDSVLFTDVGMYLFQSEEKWEYLQYEEISNLEVVEQKEITESIAILKKNGVQVYLRILGGNGKLRDVWEVYRFLLRITNQ
ncbi:hypothetical protein [Leptospira neocaledonica]|uniref:YokE-like PH domain-containing protein n=1 Tax=Leptospira neocaledonica TaxID=2023192 RepID=A0A2M9ZUA2_9LEPT|nr:hypothetical protein [Leptospira neocaledonica]PJZ75676.1 hypothetical protein CH365_18225 [Leptospira neocaledonica]